MTTFVKGHITFDLNEDNTVTFYLPRQTEKAIKDLARGQNDSLRRELEKAVRELVSATHPGIRVRWTPVRRLNGKEISFELD